MQGTGIITPCTATAFPMFRHLVSELTLPAIASRDGIGALRPAVKRAAAQARLPAAQLQSLQVQRLRRLLTHAAESVPFYRDRLTQAGLNPAEFDSLEQLCAVPPLTKADIHAHADALIASGLDRATLTYSVSGGTTGRSIGLYNDRAALAEKLAAQMRFDRWAGWRPGDYMGLIWPATVDQSKAKSTWRSRLRNALSYREIKLHQIVIDPESFAAFADEMARTDATAIRGFPFQVDEVAGYFASEGRRLPALSGVITTGEPLYPDQRERIEWAFRCPVFDSYRTREVGCIAQECEVHHGYHVSADTVCVEVVPLDDPAGSRHAAPGEAGKVLVTDLTNFAMPFIRYEIGDIGALSASACGCGREWPLLDSIGGRITDLLYTPDGRKISPITVLPNLFHMLGIMNQFRMIQDRLDHITIQMAGSAPDAALLDRQRTAFVEVFGPDMRYDIEYVERIEAVGSGKFPLVISKISPPA